MQIKEVSVIGSGSWATALVKVLLNKYEKVNWWIRETEIIDHLNSYNHNPLYLRSVKFDTSRLSLSDDINKTIEKSQLVVFCVPSVYLHAEMQKMKPGLLDNRIIVSAIKGIVPQYNMVAGEYFRTHHGVNSGNMSVITGPSHAEEVALEKLTYLTIASANTKLAELIADLFSCRYIKTSVSNDIVGTEYAPVLKNIVAIASGICNGLGYGDNFQAVLVSNAIKEVKYFLDEMSPLERNINDSVYLGDLLVTSYSQFSRNRMFGNMIGKGYSAKFAHYEMKMVVEGYYAVKSIHQINLKNNLKMPITETVYNILYENVNPKQEISKLSDKLK